MEHPNVSKLARRRKKLKKKVLIIGGKAWSIINFRGNLIRRLVKEGYTVTAVASEAKESDYKDIKNFGIEYINLCLITNAISVLKDFNYFLALRKVISEYKPNIVISYTFKPVVYSGLALFFKKKINFFPLITGLGNVFNTKKIFLYPIKFILIYLLKLTLRNSSTIIFQNIDNLQEFKKLKIAPNVEKIIIEGSGIDVNYFKPELSYNNSFTFLLIARLLKDKGIFEYIEAAKKIKSNNQFINFNLIGPKDNSSNQMNFDYVTYHHRLGYINYLGFQKNVKHFIANSHVYVLPSYHEGLPRSVLEAMAMSKPIITTEAPGCKETVINYWNGFLIPIKNIDILVEKMNWFINNKSKIFEMGKKSREIVEKRFSSSKINDELIKLLSKYN